MGLAVYDRPCLCSSAPVLCNFEALKVLQPPFFPTPKLMNTRHLLRIKAKRIEALIGFTVYTAF